MLTGNRAGYRIINGPLRVSEPGRPGSTRPNQPGRNRQFRIRAFEGFARAVQSEPETFDVGRGGIMPRARRRPA